MRLNWFSPLPPARTDIAGFTARLLPALCRRAEVVLWTDQEEWDTALAAYGPVRRFDPGTLDWVDLHRADVTVYNIANNPGFHGAAWQVSRRHPGVVVLHDLSLQHLFAGIHGDDLDGYSEIMGRYYGSAGRWAAEAWWSDRVSVEFLGAYFPLTRLALEGALGVVVHSRRVYEALRKAGQLPALHAELIYPATPGRSFADRSAGPPYRLVVFGYIGPNRRLASVLEALARLPRRACFRLDVYGQVWDADLVRGQIATHGLEDRVALHGFVPEADLERALALSHLAINLRVPTVGEASGSQLHIWDHALPSLVSRVGWYADLPADAVAFVRPEREVEDLAALLEDFAERPGHYARMGLRGRQLLDERHTPDAYAERLLALAGRVRQLRARAEAVRTACRAGELLADWVAPYAAQEVYDRVARAVHELAA
jgi:glycosyltransferase involved in cell wall biosynthesis